MANYLIKDITNYIKSTTINEARERGVFVTEVNCRFISSSNKDLIRRNIEKWIQENKVLLDKKDERKSYTYGGPAYNGRTLTGRTYTRFRYFSKFYVQYSTDDGYTEDLVFKSRSPSDLEKHLDHENFNTPGVPDMLQIAYGLIKKYPNEPFRITGGMPV